MQHVKKMKLSRVQLKNQENHVQMKAHVQLKEYQSFHMVFMVFNVMKMKLSHGFYGFQCYEDEAFTWFLML
jgi:hypothetical protein